MKTNLKGIFGFTPFVLGGFLFFFSPSLMAADISMSSNAAEQTGNLSIPATPGQTGSLSIFVDNDQASVYALQFSFTYDPQVMTISNFGDGSAMTGCNTNLNTYGNCNVLFNIPSACTTAPLPSTCTANVGLYSSTALPIANAQQIVFIPYTVNSAAAAGNYNLSMTNALFNETGLTVSNSGVITVASASTVTLTPPGSQSVTAGSALSVALSGTYSGSGTLSCSVSGLPNGDTGVCSISGTSNYTGTFTWTPSTSEVGTFYPVTITVTDGTNTAAQIITITVNTTNIVTAQAWGEVLPGDTSVTLADARAVALEAIGIKVTGFVAPNAYVDGGTSVTLTDARLIAEYAVKMITSFPAVQKS